MTKKATFNKVTFDGKPPPGVINLGIGQPSDDLLPVNLLKAASDDFLKVAHPQELNYGEKQGDIRFRESLAAFLSRSYGTEATPESLLLTCGNSQALDFICERFTQPGDTVLVEEPTYFLAFQVFRDHGLNIVPIEMDQDGPEFLDCCMLCMRCYSFCPVHAVQATERTKNARKFGRYGGPENKRYP